MTARITRIGRFDLVELTTTKRIHYISNPAGSTLSPHGQWSVVSVVGETDLLIARESVLIKVPIADIRKVASYTSPKDFKGLLEQPNDGQKGEGEAGHQQS